MINDILSQVLSNLIYVGMLFAISFITKAITAYLKVKREEIEEKEERTNIEETIALVIDIVQKSVDAVSQTYVDTLKSSGKFDAKAQAEARDKALSLIKLHLSDKAASLIQETYSDVDSWLDTQVEAYLRRSKAGNAVKS